MRNLLEKIKGNTDEYEELYDDLDTNEYDAGSYESDTNDNEWMGDQQVVNSDKALAVDVSQDEDNLYVHAFVPGIDPTTLDIDITRDQVTIKGQSYKSSSVSDDNYFQSELSWGMFARTITLPKEIDIEEAQADSEHGVLVLKLPKIDKDRKTKLRINMNR